MRVDLGDLGFDEGGHLLVKRALRAAAPGEAVEVTGGAPEMALHLEVWCRAEGHRCARGREGVLIVSPGAAEAARWKGAEPAGHADPRRPGAVAERAPLRWGLAARGATVEAGSPEFDFRLTGKAEVWADTAAALYAQAAAAQWNPATAIPWDAAFDLPAEVEDAVVQIMTYLVENETAALIVPSRFLAQLHPHFREVMQLLAVQAADEARHVEVFTRRALLKRDRLGLSTAGGQASLKTLVDEPEFAIAAFLLSVLGEGSFLVLLWFLERHAPDPVTEAVARLAAQDEARHVAFGLAHLRRRLDEDPGFRSRLSLAVRQRHEALRHTAGLNREVFDALLVVAAGGWDPGQLRLGHRRVMGLLADMDAARRNHLRRLGFADEEAAELSGLHTRNFM